MEEAIIKTLEGKTLWITMNRPKQYNAINEDWINGMLDALEEARNNEQIRCVVITGAGKAFCAGGDLGHLSSLHSDEERQAFIAKVGSAAKKIMALPKPVLAMVNGVAAGAGANLMLACDIIYAHESARFAQSFAKVGLMPDFGGLYLLPKAVGIHKAKELMFTADLIGAGEAKELGMVTHVCGDELQSRVNAMAKRLEEAAPLAIRRIKAYLNQPELTLDEVLQAEAKEQTLLMESEDFAEGAAAFKEKRDPVFSGK